MKLETYRLRLVADATVPRFRRLRCSLVDVPLADVFGKGVHPHSHTTGLGHDSWGVADAIVERLNATEAFVPDLLAHQVSYSIVKPTTASSWHRQSPVILDRLLGDVQGAVYFTEDVTYDQIRDIAVDRLRETWSHPVARQLAREVAPGFAGIRAFLKSVDPNLKLVGYDSLDNYDLGRVLTVDHFLSEDRLLLMQGLELQNFRRAGALSQVTTADGRLRLVPKIDRCTVEWREHPGNKEASVQYRCLVDGSRVRWEPDLKPDDAQRCHARRLAEEIGHGTGRYCFESSLADLDRTLDDERFRLRFPRLRYGPPLIDWVPSAKLRTEAVPCYCVPAPLSADKTNEVLHHVLREFGRRTSGRKDQLIRRIAQLLAEQYGDAEPELDAFFGARRFVRLKAGHGRWRGFAVLLGHPLSPSLLTMFCLRHMRGNVILEASHRNTSVALTDLAEAILHRRVKLEGAFVEVL